MGYSICHVTCTMPGVEGRVGLHACSCGPHAEELVELNCQVARALSLVGGGP